MAPASIPSIVCSYVASLWPSAATTPSAAASLITSSAFGSSGAIVSIRTWPRPAFTSARNSATSGSRSSVGSCAPQRDLAM